jgi:hypothetical protein
MLQRPAPTRDRSAACSLSVSVGLSGHVLKSWEETLDEIRAIEPFGHLGKHNLRRSMVLDR